MLKINLSPGAFFDLFIETFWLTWLAIRQQPLSRYAIHFDQKIHNWSKIKLFAVFAIEWLRNILPVKFPLDKWSGPHNRDIIAFDRLSAMISIEMSVLWFKSANLNVAMNVLYSLHRAPAYRSIGNRQHIRDEWVAYLRTIPFSDLRRHPFVDRRKFLYYLKRCTKFLLRVATGWPQVHDFTVGDILFFFISSSGA